MVAIKQAGLLREVRRREDTLQVILIHGSDSGRVNSIASQAVEAACGSRDDPFLVEKLSWSGIGGSAARIHEEVLSLSMTGGRRAIWLTDGREGVRAAIAPLLAGEIKGNVLVVECESLPKSSQLRALVESDSTALCIAVYEADRDELAAVVDAAAAASKLRLSAGARQHLVEIAGAGSSLLRQEIEKLSLYCGTSPSATAEDVEKICGDGAQTTIDDVVDAVFAGRLDDADRDATRLSEGGVQAGRVLSSALEHVFKLQSLSVEVMSGSPVEAVLRAPRQQIFFKRRLAIRNQLEAWDLRKLQSAARILSSAILHSRRNSRLEPAVAARALLKIANMARRLSLAQ